MVNSFIQQPRYMRLINISPSICIGRVISTFSMSTSSITEDIHFNIGLNKTIIVLITARNIVFINNIIPNSVDFLSYILFGTEHTWGQ